MTAARAGATTTLLSNGKVLVAGGYFIDGAGATVPLATAELYDPASGTFSATGSLANARYNHTATLLADGRVLIAGGAGNDVALASAELYDQATGRFASAGSMTTARIGHAAALLPGGRVLLIGGTDSLGPARPIYLASAETYDPAAGTFAAAGSMSTVRYGHTATALGDARVLTCGGLRSDSEQKSSLATCERYDPQSHAFEPASAMSAARSGQAAVMLADGRVLIAGGQNVESQSHSSYPASADLYDPAAGSFSSAGAMLEGRMSPTATRLADGRVLIAGGANSIAITSSAELYQP
jgi:N-acetylneuraminic acid mutarotase